uniref:Putative tick transposon n=1 Tax=Ixodes ricinus TaxID=34613 RepID=A0A6B0V699_IXORI
MWILGVHFMGVYFLVLVDAYSKWVEVVRVPSPSAEATVAYLRSISAIHGLPDGAVSDNNPAFTGFLYKTFLARNAVRQILVPPYHPASNGAAERVVQTVKEKLKKTQPGDFECRIARVLFAYRTTPHSLTGRSPAELLMGRRLKTALNLLQPDLRSKVQFRQLQQKVLSDRSARREPVPQPADPVWARNFRPGPRWVPAVVGRATSTSSTEVRLPDGRVWERHGDHLRHQVSKAEVQPSTKAEVLEPPLPSVLV